MRHIVYMYSRPTTAGLHCVLSSVQLTSAQPSVNDWFRDRSTSAYVRYYTSAVISLSCSAGGSRSFANTTCHVNRDIQLPWYTRYATFDCVYLSESLDLDIWPIAFQSLSLSEIVTLTKPSSCGCTLGALVHFRIYDDLVTLIIDIMYMHLVGLSIKFECIVKQTVNQQRHI